MRENIRTFLQLNNYILGRNFEENIRFTERIRSITYNYFSFIIIYNPSVEQRMPLISTLYKCLKIFTNVQIYIFIRINVIEEISFLSLPLSHFLFYFRFASFGAANHF